METPPTGRRPARRAGVMENARSMGFSLYRNASPCLEHRFQVSRMVFSPVRTGWTPIGNDCFQRAAVGQNSDAIGIVRASVSLSGFVFECVRADQLDSAFQSAKWHSHKGDFLTVAGSPGRRKATPAGRILPSTSNDPPAVRFRGSVHRVRRPPPRVLTLRLHGAL